MRVLVTGGAGFIGSQIVEAGLQRGWDVRILDSLRSDVHGGDYRPPTGAEFVRGDVRDVDALAAGLVGVQLVFHQAAKVGLGVDFADAPDYVSSNSLGTAMLLAAMTERQIDRLVVASSMVVYGEGLYSGSSGPTRPPARRLDDLKSGRFDPLDEDGTPLVPELITEDVALDPRNVYAATKLEQELLASAWARSTGGRAAALRYHNVFGPGMPQNTPYAGVASLFRSAIERGEAPQVFEDGAQRRDFIHVRDVAAANHAAADSLSSAQPGHFRTFNVGSGVVHTIGDFAAELHRHAGGPAPEVTGQFRVGDVRHITASSARLSDELGWTPRVTFADGVREFATAPLRAAIA